MDIFPLNIGTSLQSKLSNFLFNWRLEIEKTFIGKGVLLDCFFEKLGSSLFVLFSNILSFRNSLYLESQIFDFSNNKLPSVFLISGKKCFGKKYFINELFLSYSKVSSCYGPVSISELTASISLNDFDKDKNIFETSFKNELMSLERQLITITRKGRLLMDCLFEKAEGLPLILVYFENVEFLLFSINNQSELNCNLNSGINCSYLIINLLNNYIQMWHDENIPIISFFVSVPNTSFRSTNTNSNYSETNKIKNFFKEGYRLIFEFHFDDPIYDTDDKLLLFKYFIGKKYKLSEKTLSHLINLVSEYFLEFIGLLTNEETIFLIDDMDLNRAKDIVESDAEQNIPIIICSGEFVALRNAGTLCYTFYDVFLDYLKASIKTFGCTDNGKVSFFSVIRSSAVFGDGLKDVVGCNEIISRIRNYIFPCFQINEYIPNKYSRYYGTASAVTVSGDKGSGKLVVIQAYDNNAK